MSARPLITEVVAIRFIKLVERYPDPQRPIDIGLGDMVIIRELLVCAGFEPYEIVPSTAENVRDPFVVYGESDDDYPSATGWLTDMITLVRSLVKTLIQPAITVQVMVEIERCRPLKPIPLSNMEDRLIEVPPIQTNGNYLVDHTRDYFFLKGIVGEHENCGGCLERRQFDAVYDRIECRDEACSLRVCFPGEIKTYGELRSYMVKKLKLGFKA